ncbi:helix-turn-helix transcriptional regulator [Dyadobacter subterraneus]|uniref:Helix-turn-helix domain-containing protein n=1 Tax=Dyadobacter subterraneus TaxID=2773304 RepID=A0ABR9WGS9_9BACT|nr:helix-turn-helix domain-containing protein [Dyadobacter subterraneus]MBE9464713.1 hypothetical protein [Dyadobacter subterraneus]
MDNPFHNIDIRLGSIESTLLKIVKKNDSSESESLVLNADQYIDQKRVSELLGVSTVTIWDWERKGLLKSYRIGNLKRFKLSEVMDAPQPIKRTFRASKLNITDNV